MVISTCIPYQPCYMFAEKRVVEYLLQFVKRLWPICDNRGVDQERRAESAETPAQQPAVCNIDMRAVEGKERENECQKLRRQGFDGRCSHTVREWRNWLGLADQNADNADSKALSNRARICSRHASAFDNVKRSSWWLGYGGYVGTIALTSYDRPPQIYAQIYIQFRTASRHD